MDQYIKDILKVSAVVNSPSVADTMISSVPPNSPFRPMESVLS